MLQSAPVVSVVIPAYRCEQILARALGSLLAQSLGNWEAIIVDDGSPDASWGVMQAYTWLDPRIRAIRREHRGVCAARNAGIAEAVGQYLLFLDADDWLESDALAALTSACEHNDWIAAAGGLRYVTQDGTATEWNGGLGLESPLFESLCGSNAISVPSSALVRRAIIEDIGPFDTTLVHCGDWDFWGRVARHRVRGGHVDKIVTCYRMSPGSLSRNPQTLLRDASTVIRRLHAPDPRVRVPHSSYAAGADPEGVVPHIAHFAVYCAALSAASGNSEQVIAVLNSISQWPPLNPVRTAEFAFYGLCFSRCHGPETFRDFWDDVATEIFRLFRELETRTSSRGLARQLWRELERCAGGELRPTSSNMPNPAHAFRPPAHDGWETYAGDTLLDLARRGSS
jgi:glycosyltransferase involved in cell wall biosynthesis